MPEPGRASVILKLPNNLLDLHNSLKENIKSNRDENFLLVNHYENNILVFSTITNLKFLSQVDTILVDGTFKSCPKLFTQFYFIFYIYTKIFFGLPFLKPEDVVNCFTDDIVSMLPRNEKVEAFTDYIINTYITPDCDYPPSLWVMYSGSIITRTTNSCEAFHSKLNGIFYSAHPNIYKFIDILKNVQKDTYIKIRSSSHKKKIRREICEKQEFFAIYI